MSRFHKTLVVERRQMLRGVGVALALPFLPSLYPARAYGLSLALPRRKRYFSTFSLTGCIRRRSFFPPDESTQTDLPLVGGWVGRVGPLVSRVEGNDRIISPVLRAPAAKLTQRIADRMTVVSGLDIPLNLNHHSTQPLGYYRNDFNSVMPFGAVPTVDQILAWSRSFYGANLLSPVPVVRRSISFEFAGLPASHYYADPENRLGAIVPTERFTKESSSRALFDSLFLKPSVPPAPTDLKKSILDRVVQRWNSLRQGNKRISAADRSRLDQHLEQLRSLELRLASQVEPVCTAARPDEDLKSFSGTSRADEIKQCALMNDLIAMSFACDTTRVAIHHHHANFVNFQGSWDQDVLDGGLFDQSQRVLVESQQATFEYTILDLAQKLEQPQGDGSTLLDDSLLQWTHAFGSDMHYAVSVPVVAIGDLGSGRYFDFRNRSKAPNNVGVDEYGYGLHMPGVHYGRWLKTVLDFHAVDPGSYELGNFLRKDLGNMPMQYRSALLSGQLDSQDRLPMISKELP